jgi:hypothetical protein
VQDRRSIEAVPEGDMLECDIAADRRKGGASGIVDRLGRGVENVAKPRNR